MERLVVVVVVLGVAMLVAVVVDRRRPDAPTQARWSSPAQLDRDDFERPEAPWVVVVFTSATCSSCARAVSAADAVAGPSVAVHDVQVGERPDLHRRYGIDAVPTVVVADAGGVVRASFHGEVSVGTLQAAMSDRARES